MSAHLAAAANLLGIVRQQTDAIGCAVSFGKDSLATLDLCCRLFPRVEAYYLYRVRELRCVADWAREVFLRHGVQVRMYPHFDLVRCYTAALFQPHWRGLDRVPRIGFADLEAKFRADTGVEWIAYGWRRNDSFSRALIMRKCRGLDWETRRVFPLRAFKRREVYAYLLERGIPPPPTLGRREQGGLDFVPAALVWLRDEFPDDYARWLRDFPFAAMQLARAQGG